MATTLTITLNDVQLPAGERLELVIRGKRWTYASPIRNTGTTAETITAATLLRELALLVDTYNAAERR